MTEPTDEQVEEALSRIDVWIRWHQENPEAARFPVSFSDIEAGMVLAQAFRREREKVKDLKSQIKKLEETLEGYKLGAKFEADELRLTVRGLKAQIEAKTQIFWRLGTRSITSCECEMCKALSAVDELRKA